MNFLIQKPNPLTIAQYLVIGGLVSIAISPPLANIFIALSLIATLSVSTIRNQLIDFFKTKLGYACIAFIAVLFSGLVYGIESNSVIASSIWGWRKFLMLPIAAAIFMNAPHAKQNLINSFWFVCLILVIYSFVTLFNPGLQISDKNLPGVVVRNHATQGLFFAVAAMIAVANALNVKHPNWLRIISGLTVPLLITNIAMVATGRSGYVAITVMTITFLFIQLEKSSITKKILITFSGFLIILGVLLNMQTSRDQIELAKQEFTSEIDQTKETSIGYRLTFWKNTIEMLPKYALLGTGTGGFEKAYAAQVEGKSGTAGVVTGDPHNQYLKILVEHGVIGLAVFLSILILLLWQPTTNPFKAIGVASLLAIATTSLFNAHFSTFNEGQFIWIFAGSLLASEALSMHRKI
jgi:O-antigen ligase